MVWVIKEGDSKFNTNRFGIGGNARRNDMYRKTGIEKGKPVNQKNDYVKPVEKKIVPANVPTDPYDNEE